MWWPLKVYRRKPCWWAFISSHLEGHWNDEYDGGAHYPVLNSIGASKEMEAHERNALDEFLHKYINSVLARVGDRVTPRYCIVWLQNKLVIAGIGLTRLLLSKEVSLTGAQIKRMVNEIHQRFYGFVNIESPNIVLQSVNNIELFLFCFSGKVILADCILHTAASVPRDAPAAPTKRMTTFPRYRWKLSLGLY